MGEKTPEFINLRCEACGSRFRIRPTKGRLPKGPIACPSCSGDVQLPTELRKSDSRPDGDTTHIPGLTDKRRAEADVERNRAKSAPMRTMMGMPALDENFAFDAGTSYDHFPGDFDLGDDKSPMPDAVDAADAHSSTTKPPWESKSSANIDLNELAERSRNPAVDEPEAPKLSDLMRQAKERRVGAPGLPAPSVPTSGLPAPSLSAPSAAGLPAPDVPAPGATAPDLKRPLSKPKLAAPNLSKPKAFEGTPLAEKAKQEAAREPKATPAVVETAVESGARIEIVHPTEPPALSGVFRVRKKTAAPRRVEISKPDEISTKVATKQRVLGVKPPTKPTKPQAPPRAAAPAAPMTEELTLDDEAIQDVAADDVAPSVAPVAPMTEELLLEDEVIESMADEPAAGTFAAEGLEATDGMFPTSGYIGTAPALPQSQVAAAAFNDFDEAFGVAEPPADPQHDLAPAPEQAEPEEVEPVVEPTESAAEAAAPPHAAAKPAPPKATSKWIPGLAFAAAIALGAGAFVALGGDPKTDDANVAEVDKPAPPQTNGAPAPTETATQEIAQVDRAPAETTQTAAQLPTSDPPPQPTEAIAVAKPIPQGVVELTGLTAARALTSNSLAFESGGQRAVFYADTSTSHRPGRATQAAQTLCQTIRCGIEFAPMRPAVLPVDELKRANVTLADAVIADGALHGVVIYEVAGAAQLPLAKVTPLWRKWLRQSNQELDVPVTDQRDALVEALGEARATALLGQLGGVSVRELSRMISDVMVLDFLTNNFDRFDSSDEAWNLAVKGGKIYSLDETGAMQTRTSTRVKGRFAWTERFDRDVYENLKSVDVEKLSEALLPEPSNVERTMLKVFAKQHAAYLERVDAAAAKDASSAFF